MRQLTLPSLLPQRTPRTGRGRVAPAKRRAAVKRRSPRRLAGLLRPAAAGAAGLLLLAAATLALRHGGLDILTDAVVAWTGSAGVAVRDVLVVGRNETSADEILAALDVRKGSPLLAFSPANARERLLALGWVRDARVERRFPNVVFVALDERRPVAIWQYDGDLALVDETGAVIGAEAAARFASLPVIVGPDAPEHFAALFAVLESRPELRERVVAAIRVGGRRWNLRLTNGMTVLLPERNIATAWRVLADAVQDKALLERDVVHIDLRIADRMVLRLAPGAVRPKGDDRGA